jgi:phage shock protein A
MPCLPVALFAAAWLCLPLAPALCAQARPTPPPPDLATIRKEPDLQKRYTAALNFASARIDAARKHIEAGDQAAYEADLKEFVEAIQFSEETVRATGKDPSRDSRHFKRVELRMNEFRRRLASLEQEVSIEDRGPATEALAKLQQRHDHLLQDIMGRRK